MKMNKTARRDRIKHRVRRKVNGTAEKPRLTVYRSNRGISCQIIDDVAGATLVSASTKEKAFETTGTKSDQAKEIGKLIAERAKGKDIEAVVFDRSGYLYHGRVKALAEGAREGGLKF
ncbi:MAG TPA: 50S ribosomal protein L18 [Membranihabitans sp.]|nr:50S ribosomal protein L18 [Membranihabitans sp.]